MALGGSESFHGSAFTEARSRYNGGAPWEEGPQSFSTALTALARAYLADCSAATARCL